MVSDEYEPYAAPEVVFQGDQNKGTGPFDVQLIASLTASKTPLDMEEANARRINSDLHQVGRRAAQKGCVS